MSALPDIRPARRRHTGTPGIALWLALSLLLHLGVLLWSPPLRQPESAQPASPPLTVVLRPETPPEVALPSEPTPPPPAAVAPPAKAVPRQPPPAPPVIALTKPKPEQPPAFTVPAPKVEEPPTPTTPAAPPTQSAPQPPLSEPDLAAYIAARRRARGEVPSDAPAADVERANRGALNSALLKQPLPTTFAPERPRNGYGSFEIRRRGFDYAEFMFKGWNENFRRDGLELIEVRLGNHGNIDLAVVRSIIAVIRRTESGDFTWVSRRLGRSLTLSARARDNAGLEEFMMQEFYDDLHRYR